MANNTIYPYGTNGELPTSIGIINDLNTGGADKALSAEQGKILNNRLTTLEKADYTFETRFTTTCEVAPTQQTKWSSVALSTTVTSAVYNDNCVLYLPSTYTKSGTPTKLIIFCKQGSSKIGVSSSEDWEQKTKGRSPILALPFMPYLISIGYAILGVDGEPDEWLEAINLGDNIGSSSADDNEADFGAYGNYVAVQSVCRAYDYVIKHFNIDTEGCFIFGYSQGGMLVQNVVDLTPIPILAAAEFSPSCSYHFHQWDNSRSPADLGNVTGVTYKARLIISRMYGFGASVTENSQLVDMTWDTIKDKLIGYDPFTRNVVNPFTQFTDVSGGRYAFSSGVSVSDVDMVKYSRCPLKVWCGSNDTILGVDVMKTYVKAIKNGGGVADIVIFSSGGHSFFSSQSNAGSCVVNGTTYNYKPVALDLATWFRNFGGY